MQPAKQNQRLGRAGALGAALVALAACASDPGPHPNLPPLGIQAEFTSRNLCGLGVSPEVRLTGVPGGTTTYRWRMTDVNALFGSSWQTDLPAEGSGIPEGAASDFPAPCLGELERATPNTYRFEIMALDAAGQPLAYGWQFITARSVAYQLEIEEQRRLGLLPAAGTVSRQRPHFFIY